MAAGTRLHFSNSRHGHSKSVPTASLKMQKHNRRAKKNSGRH